MKKVLVVDDSLTIRMQVRMSLRPEKYEVLEAENGQDGLNIIEQNEDLSFIILDIDMPVMNGIEMLEKVRENKSSSHIPVFIMTTNNAANKISEAKSKGATGFIVKPFTPKQLSAIITKFAS